MALFLEEWLRFAVPLFLLTAGFLFNKSDVPATTLLRRMGRRIVVPYLVCSVFMLWFRATWLFEPRLSTVNPLEIARLVLTGRTLGIYYFVVLILGLYLFSLWLRRWPTPWIVILWTVVGLRWLTSSIESLNALGRTAAPMRPVVGVIVASTFMYLMGWLLSLRYSDLRPFLRRHSGWLIGVALVVEVMGMLLIMRIPADDPWYPSITCAHFVAVFVGLMGVGLGWPAQVPAIRFLSNASYAIYLLHFPILRAIQYTYVNEQNLMQARSMLIPWVLSLGGTVLLVLALKRILGRYSRCLIGA